MGTKTWTASIDGVEIKVTNHFSVLGWESWESLSVGDRLVQRNDGGMWRPSSFLSTRVETPYGIKEISALIAGLGFSVGCHIFSDGELVAGDTESKLNAPSPVEWDIAKTKGVAHFLLLRGVMGMGVPFALMLTLVNVISGDHSIGQSVLMFVINCILFGLVMGYFQWWSFRKLYDE
ncbi:MAG: hypothetical protein AAF542_25530 [Pseudomonadota bacterium]